VTTVCYAGDGPSDVAEVLVAEGGGPASMFLQALRNSRKLTTPEFGTRSNPLVLGSLVR
jgi:hypothetical protein